MGSITTFPTTAKRPALPPRLRERTERAAPASGLVDLQTSHAKVPREPNKARLNRMRRIVIGAADEMQLAHQRAGHRYRAAMVTLTYHDRDGWYPKDISRFMQRVRDWMARRGHQLRAVWVMELQKRGAPHYHVLIFLPRGLTLPKPDKQGWWEHGSTRIEWARKPVGYLAKYTSKGDDDAGAMPHGARVYGVYGSPVHLGWWRAPKWLRDIADKRMTISKRKGGWWTVKELAHAWRSPWRVLHIGPQDIEIEWVGWTSADIVDLWTLDKHRQLERST